MDVQLTSIAELRFRDGAPVRAASAVARFGEGFLVAQDDATHAAWLPGAGAGGQSGGHAEPVRLLPPEQGRETFDEASGTKHLKPDLEAAFEVTVEDLQGVLLLGSGSSPHRTRWSHVRHEVPGTQHQVADLAPLYAVVARALGVEADLLNMEGACVLGETLRWFHRGMPSAGWPSASVDLPLAAALDAALGRAAPEGVPVTDVLTYDLGEVDGVGLAITDAVALPDGAVLVSAAAEDSPNPRDDGPVVGSALALLRDGVVRSVAQLPHVHGRVAKVEGLTLLEVHPGRAAVLAVVDADDPDLPSVALELSVRR